MQRLALNLHITVSLASYGDTYVLLYRSSRMVGSNICTLPLSSHQVRGCNITQIKSDQVSNTSCHIKAPKIYVASRGYKGIENREKHKLLVPCIISSIRNEQINHTNTPVNLTHHGSHLDDKKCTHKRPTFFYVV